MFFEPLESRRVLATDLAAITGIIFSDQTDDGLSGDDTFVAGAVVNLYRDGGNGTFESVGGVSGDDTFVGTDTTDAAGAYRFDSLPAGTYFVEEVVPAGFIVRTNANVQTVTLDATDVQGVAGVSIDDFSTTNQLVTANSGTPTAASALAATEAEGGERDLFVEYVSGAFDADLRVSNVTSSLIASSDLGTTANYTVVWDGADGDATTLDATGLGGIDLSAAGVADRLQLMIGADHAGVILTINVYTDAANSSQFVTTIPVTAGGLATSELLVPFTSILTNTGTGADFTNVGAIEIQVTGVAALQSELALFGSIGPTVETVNIANFEPLTLGNLVFNDLNNDGIFNSGTEAGISGVALSLYSDTDGNGSFTAGTDTLVATTTTNGSGVYLFTNLFPGNYIVQIDESNFNVGNALEGLRSSTGNEPTPDPDDNVNNDDNGDHVAGQGIVSAAITLLPNTEPINDGDADPDTNLTLDFGVYEELDLSVTKTVDNDSPNVGDNITFTITVANAGPANGTNITVDDVLPAGLAYVSDTPSQGSYNSTTGVWTVGSLASGSNAMLQIVTLVISVGTKTNTAQVTAVDQFDIDSTPNNDVATEDDQDSVDAMPLAVDLSLIKTVSNATPNVGDNVTFTITTSNAGPNDATSVAVGDTLPVGVTYVSDTPSQGTYNTGTGIWTVGTIANGANATLQIVASVDSIGAKTNTAEVTAADQADIDSTPNNNVPTEDDQDEVVVTPQVADLSLTKTVSNATPNVGENVTFTITASNAGPDAATNVTVSDTLPAGTTFVSSTPSQGSYNSTTGLWTVGTIANAGNGTLQIVASVDSVGTKTNTAQVSAADQADPDSTPNNNVPAEDDQASVSLTPQVADLSLTKIVNNATPNVGDDVTFTITVSNAGPDSATNVAVADLLPAGMTFVSNTPSQGTYNSTTGVWTVGTIANAGNATLRIVATVATIGTKTNTAQVSAADQADPDSTPNNSVATEDDQASVSLTPQVADLSLAKTVSDATPNVGANVTFTLTLANAGPDSATNVAVTDQLPAGLTFVSNTPSQGSYNSTTGVWTVGTVANGGIATLQIVAAVASIGAKTNSAQVTAADQADPDSTPNNNVATEDDQASAIVIPRQVDVGITKSVSPGTVTLGGSLTYTLTVTNSGPDAATGVSVVDTLPADVTFNSAISSQGTATQAGGVVTAALGTIASGQSATITIVVTPTTTNATAGTVTNVAAVSVTEFDTNTANNTAQVTAAVDFLMASIAGAVYNDLNNNGIFEPTESGIANVTLRLTGTDLRGAAVDITMQTAADGSYLFDNLNPGIYQLQETQPAGFRDGIDTAGTGATATVGQDIFLMIDLVDGAMAQAFNFGERGELSKRRFLASS
ncbi:MAG TPA: SdrD B-like domain-containing protein [Pirellulaceae bacterium]|nr:SdrD B-like domain-containing protein [Pirellulaceae bacterium]